MWPVHCRLPPLPWCVAGATSGQGDSRNAWGEPCLAACSGRSWGKWLPGVLARGRQRWEKRETHGRAPPCTEPGTEIIGGAKNEQDITCWPCVLGAGGEQSAGKPCSAAAPTRLPAGTGWRPLAAGEGSCQGRSWPAAAHVAFREAGRLCVPQFPSAEMCCVQQDGPQVLACQWWPWRARLLCAGAAVL